MTDLVVQRAKVDPKAYLGRPVSKDGLAELPVGSVVRAPDGQPLLAYLRVWEPGDPQLEALRRLLLAVQIKPSTRPNGMVVRSVLFGRRGRSMPRRDWCTQAVLDRDHPAVLRRLHDLGTELERRYAELAPATYDHHVAQASRVLPEWRLPEMACFTGGVINRDNAIAYHHDSGNFKATFSAMPVIRQDMDGGELVVPELGCYLPTADGTVTYFDGQSLLHGVTPLRKRKRTAHRFSVVFYSEVKLWQCLPPAAEVERIQQRRTERELRRAQAGRVRVAQP